MYTSVARAANSGREDLEEWEENMLVVVSTYRAKIGEEDAIIALHEDRQRNQDLKVRSYLSWELLQKIENPSEFIDIARFPSEELARSAASDLEREGWYDRLVSLIEGGQIRTDYTSVWQLS
jgi:hypothetical protein